MIFSVGVEIGARGRPTKRAAEKLQSPTSDMASSDRHLKIYDLKIYPFHQGRIL
jgi:hypothetical protein